MAHIFLSIETAHTYYIAFHQLFHCLSEVNCEPIQFYYLHGRGLRTVIVDMDTKQAAGIILSTLNISLLPVNTHMYP